MRPLVGCSDLLYVPRQLNRCLQVTGHRAADEVAPPSEESNSLPIRQRPNIDVLAVDPNEFIHQLHVERESMGDLIPDAIQEFDRRH